MLFLGIFGCCDRHTRLYRSTQYEQRTGRISPLPAAVRAGTKVISTHLNDSLMASGTTGTLRDKVLIDVADHISPTTLQRKKLLIHTSSIRDATSPNKSCWWESREFREQVSEFKPHTAAGSQSIFARWTEHVGSERYLPQITILCPQLEKRSYHNGNKLCSVQLFLSKNLFTPDYRASFSRKSESFVGS